MQQDNSILKHWQTIAGIVSFVFAAGMFYGENKAIRAKLTEIENRQERQFQLYQTVDKRMSEAEKKAAYEEGYHKAKDK